MNGLFAAFFAKLVQFYFIIFLFAFREIVVFILALRAGKHEC